VPSDTKALYAEHRVSLLNYATRLVGSRAQAEDLVQEAWMRLDGAALESDVQRPLGYLYRIIRNLALDHSRSVGRQRVWCREGEGNVEGILGLRDPPLLGNGLDSQPVVELGGLWFSMLWRELSGPDVPAPCLLLTAPIGRR